MNGEINDHLRDAVIRNDPDGIKQWLERGADITMATNRHGDTLLHDAVEYRAEKSVSALIKAGLKVDCVNHNGETALFTAIRRDDYHMISQLSAHGANLDHEDPFGITPLIMAACIGKHDAIRQLITLGANPDYRTQKGMSMRKNFAVGDEISDILTTAEPVLNSPNALLDYISRKKNSTPEHKRDMQP